MERMVAFDIETAKITPEGADLRKERPLGITCVGLYYPDGVSTRYYHQTSERDEPHGEMSVAQCGIVLRDLARMTGQGYKVISHNGAGFDLDILGEEAGLRYFAGQLARAHYDMMLEILTIMGYPIGLAALAKGLGLGEKHEGISGASAPELWAQSQESRYKVLEYVVQDAKLTLDVFQAVEERGELVWITKKGKKKVEPWHGWHTVAECLASEQKMVDWIKNPLRRSEMTQWINLANFQTTDAEKRLWLWESKSATPQHMAHATRSGRA